MGWHLRSIKHECQFGSCASTATQELYNAYNARSGVFCSRHAKIKLREAAERWAAQLREERDATVEAK